MFTEDEYDSDGMYVTYGSPEIDKAIVINTPDNRYDYKGNYKNLDIEIKEEDSPDFRTDINYTLPIKVYEKYFPKKQSFRTNKMTKKAKGTYDLSVENAMENENFFTDYLKDNIYGFELSSTSSNNGKKPYEWDVIFNPSDDLLTDKKFTINEKDKDYEIKYYSDEPNGSFLMITFHDINLPILNKVVKYVNRELPELIEKKKGNKVAKKNNTNKLANIINREINKSAIAENDYFDIIEVDENDETIDLIESDYTNGIATVIEKAKEIANNEGKHIIVVNRFTEEDEDGNEYVNDDLNETVWDSEKDVEIERYGVEFRNMNKGYYNIVITDTEEKAKTILKYLKELEDETDEKEIIFTWEDINSLTTDSIEEIDTEKIERLKGIYKGIKIINYNKNIPQLWLY